jgi:hypothetical protein
MADSLPMQLKGTEEFCKITFKVKTVGSETVSEAHILVLCEKLAPVIADSSQIVAKFSPKEIASAIQAHVEKISIPVTAQLACVPVTVEQTLDLAAGADGELHIHLLSDVGDVDLVTPLPGGYRPQAEIMRL